MAEALSVVPEVLVDQRRVIELNAGVNIGDDNANPCRRAPSLVCPNLCHTPLDAGGSGISRGLWFGDLKDLFGHDFQHLRPCGQGASKR